MHQEVLVLSLSTFGDFIAALGDFQVACCGDFTAALGDFPVASSGDFTGSPWSSFSQ